MKEETKSIILEALARQERFYRSTAESERIDAIHCRRSGDPVIRARAENLDERAADCDKKADAYKAALEDFENSPVHPPQVGCDESSDHDSHKTTAINP